MTTEPRETSLTFRPWPALALALGATLLLSRLAGAAGDPRTLWQVDTHG